MIGQASFRESTQALLKHLKSAIRHNGHLPRPFCIEFAGSPSSGKTTTIIELDKFFRRNGFRVYHPQEGAEVIRYIERNRPLHNVRTGLHALLCLIDQCQSSLYDIVLFDRCIFDAYCWMTHHEEAGRLTAVEGDMLRSFFASPQWTHYIDIAYFMVCDADEAMKRELRLAVVKSGGNSTNPTSIRKFVRRYREVHNTLRVLHPQLTLIDTTTLDEETMVRNVVEETVQRLQRHVEECREKQ